MQHKDKEVVAIKFTGSGNFNRDSHAGSDWYHKRNIMADISRERKGESFGVEAMKRIIVGIGMAAGQPEKYARSWATPGKLKLLEQQGILEFIYEDEFKLDSYNRQFLDYLKNEADYNWIDSFLVMKKLGILPTKVAHRGWRNKEAVDRLTDLGLIEKFKMDPSVRTSSVLVRAIKKVA